MAQNPNLAALSAAGVSVWLEDLSRERLQTGNLQDLIDTMSVVGVTTNPSIFQTALSKGNAYDGASPELAERERRRRRDDPHRDHRRRTQRLRRACQAV
jgi:transaldolase